MTVEFVPLLQTQRDLYGLPRGMERFQAYIRTMVDADTGDLALPLVAMNPMGKDHVPALLDRYIALGADEAAREATARVAATLGGANSNQAGVFKATIVIADDLKGGWTNRYAAEFSHRFESRPLFTRGWIVGLVWTSEEPTLDTALDDLRVAIHRAAYAAVHGVATTLGEMLAQEGDAMARAGCGRPRLEPDDLAYTREVVAPLVDARDRATQMACLFGDAAARALGYRPHGLSERAGLALALADAQARLSAAR